MINDIISLVLLLKLLACNNINNNTVESRLEPQGAIG